MSSRISFNEMSNFSTDTKLTHARGRRWDREARILFPSSFCLCLSTFFLIICGRKPGFSKKISNTFIWVFPGVSHPLLQNRPLGQVEKRNVMLTFSVFCNWWICFYLQYRFTITTSTNIFITPQDHHCLTANHRKKHHKHSSVTRNISVLVNRQGPKHWTTLDNNPHYFSTWVKVQIMQHLLPLWRVILI